MRFVTCYFADNGGQEHGTWEEGTCSLCNNNIRVHSWYRGDRILAHTGSHPHSKIYSKCGEKARAHQRAHHCNFVWFISKPTSDYLNQHPAARLVLQQIRHFVRDSTFPNRVETPETDFRVSTVAPVPLDYWNDRRNIFVARLETLRRNCFLSSEEGRGVAVAVIVALQNNIDNMRTGFELDYVALHTPHFPEPMPDQAPMAAWHFPKPVQEALACFLTL